MYGNFHKAAFGSCWLNSSDWAFGPGTQLLNKRQFWVISICAVTKKLLIPN